jgi:hypothetical protein
MNEKIMENINYVKLYLNFTNAIKQIKLLHMIENKK